MRPYVLFGTLALLATVAAPVRAQHPDIDRAVDIGMLRAHRRGHRREESQRAE